MKESGFIDLSPDVMEFWFDYSTGGVGRFVQRVAEAPSNIVDAINGDFQGSITRATFKERLWLLQVKEKMLQII